LYKDNFAGVKVKISIQWATGDRGCEGRFASIMSSTSSSSWYALTTSRFCSSWWSCQLVAHSFVSMRLS